MITNIFRGMDRLPHFYQIGSVLLLSGGLTLIAFYLSQSGWLSTVSGFLSFYFIYLFTRIMSKVHNSPTRGDFSGTREILKTFKSDYQQFVDSRSTLALFIIGIPIAFGYMAFKAMIQFFLGWMQSPLVAGGFGLIVASIVCSPLLWASIGKTIAQKTSKQQDDPVDPQKPLREAERLQEYIDTENSKLEAQRASQPSAGSYDEGYGR